jgi:hypothetical protein
MAEINEPKKSKKNKVLIGDVIVDEKRIQRKIIIEPKQMGFSSIKWGAYTVAKKKKKDIDHLS